MNTEEHNRYANERNRKLKMEAFIRYSGNPPKCACCGETHIEFLSIDHINGGGHQHRKKLGISHNFYYWLKTHYYPQGYQVLCMNCNFAKGHFGICPHKKLIKLVENI